MTLSKPSRDIIVAPTTAEHRDMLKKLGFVHVTGLQLTGNEQHDFVTPQPQHFGKFGRQAGYVVACTLGGECWLRAMDGDDPQSQPINELLSQLCPRAVTGAFMPFTESTEIPSGQLLRRYVNPNWWPGDVD